MPPDMKLHTFEDQPDRLTAHGFQRCDQPTTDLSKWVRFERVLGDDDSPMRVAVQIEFTLDVTDEPLPPPTPSWSYQFEGVFLEIIDRRLDWQALTDFDPDAELPEVVGRVSLALTTLEEVRQLIALLRPRDQFGDVG
jgi:hypothetical protein